MVMTRHESEITGSGYVSLAYDREINDAHAIIISVIKIFFIFVMKNDKKSKILYVEIYDPP